MRFCTTCGRNFEGDLPACPHDGTPLFDMGAPTKEPLLAEASEPWAATSHSEPELVPEIEVDNAEIGLVDLESRSKEFPSPVIADVADDADFQAPDSSDFVGTPEPKSPIDLESALFDDDVDSAEQIAAGIDDVGSAPEVKIQQKEEVILDDALAPIQAKTSGGSKALPILLLLLVVAGAAAFFFYGGGQEMLSRPKKTETPTKKIVPPIKKKVVEVEKPVEKPVEEVVDEKIEDPDEKIEKEEPGTEKIEPVKVEKVIEPVKEIKKRKKTYKKKKKKVETVEKVEPEKVEPKKVEKKEVKEPEKKEIKKKATDDPEELLRKELEAMGM